MAPLTVHINSTTKDAAEDSVAAHPDAGASNDRSNDHQKASVKTVGDRHKEGAELGEHAEDDEYNPRPGTFGWHPEH